MIDIRNAKAIEGYMADVELRWLAKHASECQTIIEAGSYKGRSTRALADHCLGQVYAVDPWDGGYRNDDGTQARWLDTKGAGAQFLVNLEDHIRSGRVIAIPKKFGRDVAKQLPKADLVFLDGDHREAAVRHDITVGLGLVRPGGILAGHDWGHIKWPGVARAVGDVFGDRVLICKSIWWVIP